MVQSIVFATVKDQCLEYLEYIYNFGFCVSLEKRRIRLEPKTTKDNSPSLNHINYFYFLSRLVSGQLRCQNQFIMTCGDILSTGQIQAMDGIRHGALNIWKGRLSNREHLRIFYQLAHQMGA